MRIIIDGPTCSGKTTLAKRLAQKWNYQLVHLDEEAKRAYYDASIKQEVLSLLGIEEIDFDQIAKIIFTNKVKKEQLQQILYPYLNQKLANLDNVIIEGYNSTSLIKKYDLGFIISLSHEVRQEYAKKRGVSLERFNLINQNQSGYYCISGFTYFLKGDEDDIKQIERIKEKYEKNCKDS